MTEDMRRQRNAARLRECNPAFGAKVVAVIADLEGHGLRPRIQDAWRSQGAQMEAYRTGHSKLRWGLHNASTPGGRPDALAVDLLDDDSPLVVRRPYVLMLASSAASHGLRCGAEFGLPPHLRDAFWRTVRENRWDANPKIGWDPYHIEADISPLMARFGRRPK